MKQEILVKVEHMNKRFGSTVALKDVSIEVCSGRVLGLIGENGSGKSTVTSIIAGMQNADSGTMTYHDKEWKPESMLYSLEHGIGMIVQETGTVPGITVAENIFLGETKFFKSFHSVIDKYIIYFCIFQHLIYNNCVLFLFILFNNCFY